MENNLRKVCSANSAKINLRMKGLRATSGQILKGCVKDTATKLSIGSIPSNNENIIHNTINSKAFGRSSPRFKYTNSQQSTRYDEFMTSQLQASISNFNPSHSKKGFGPFIAKQKRQQKELNVFPGPGQYQLSWNIQDKIVPKNNRKLIAKKFVLKKNEKETQQSNQINPGPGSYNLNYQQERRKLLGCPSSFKTQGKRYTYIENNTNPGPGKYIQLIKQKSNNKSTSNHKKTDVSSNKQNNEKKKAQQIIDTVCKKYKKDKNYVPGPGSYQLQQPALTPFYEKIKLSNNFIQGSINRFGQHKNYWKKKESQFLYELPSTFDGAKKIKMIEGSAFMSESKRQLFVKPQIKLGPNVKNYNDFVLEKQSFLFNIYDQWR